MCLTPNLTGCDQGTSYNPKFSLTALLKEVMLPRIAHWFIEGGEYKGFRPVIQDDNVGPPTGQEFQSQYVKSYCDDMGRKWEPQAPQMPHMNNLYLAIFPATSKHHSALLSEYSGGNMPPTDDIWKCAKQVWNSLSSYTVARVVLHAYWILHQVVECKGDNSTLLQLRSLLQLKNFTPPVVAMTTMAPSEASKKSS